jgi:hypothetical protein
MLRIFIALKNPIASARFEPATLGSSGKQTKHYTTEAKNLGDKILFTFGAEIHKY